MAGRRARAFEDLRHAVRTPEFRGGVTAAEDLRVGESDGSKIRPSVLQMLFKGGPARQVATDDLRMGRREQVKPGTGRMLYGGGSVAKPSWQHGLFRGGSPDRQHAVDDTRMGEDGEDSDLPGNAEPLADGGEAFSSEEKLAAHECVAALKSGDAMKFLRAMKGLFYLMDDDGDGGEDGE